MKKIVVEMLSENYMSEATVLCRLNHSNVIGYKTCFQEGNVFYLVMEYCPLGDLRKELRRRRKRCQTFTESQVVNWTIQLCHALQVRILVYAFTHFSHHFHRQTVTALQTSAIVMICCLSVVCDQSRPTF